MVQFLFRGRTPRSLMRWAIMDIMAIEDGLFPLAYVTHTIKYLQQCKLSCSIKTLANNWLNYISSFFEDISWRTEMANYPSGP